MFIGRENELSKLEKLYKSSKFEFVIVYGRRRVGKTTLINEFCKQKKAIYFISIESTIQNNLNNLSKSIFTLTMPGLKSAPGFSSFEKALDYLYEFIKNQRVILVIDEYPYLARADKSVSSILQAYIDHKFKSSRLFLILCGSSMSFMENQVLGYKSPLYGRRTAQFKIRPFDYFDTSEFHDNFNSYEKSIIYGITGGIPQYLEFIDPKKSIRQNIIDNFFDDTGYMFEEPGNLIKQELREPQTYNAIITSIAMGASRLNEISTSSGLETSVCSVYLKSLMNLGLVKKENPVTESKTRKSIYLLEDNMFCFWYRFVLSNISGIIAGNKETIYDEIVGPRLNDYMGKVFEQMCIQHLLRRNKAGKLPFNFLKIGRWWGNNPWKKCQAEIDIVAISDFNKKALFAECKFKNEKTDIEALEKLQHNSELIKGYDEKYFFLFSKSGFSETLIKLTKTQNIELVDLDMLFNL